MDRDSAKQHTVPLGSGEIEIGGNLNGVFVRGVVEPLNKRLISKRRRDEVVVDIN